MNKENQEWEKRILEICNGDPIAVTWIAMTNDLLSKAREEERILIKEKLENKKQEKPHITSPENEAYMHSLAQFNKTIGYNQALTDVIKKMEDKEHRCEADEVDQMISKSKHEKKKVR